MLMGLKEYGSAVEFFKRSAELCGQHHVTWHNMGICLFYQDLLEDAEKCFQESLALKPTYAEAHTWLLQVREKLMKERRGPGPMPGPAPGAIRAAQSSEEDDEESEGDEDSDVSK
jgi:tetratricopeptide (TPR) repeat protein